MALVNMFVIKRACLKKSGDKAISHAQFLTNLSASLVSVQRGDMRRNYARADVSEDVSDALQRTVHAATMGHIQLETTDMVGNGSRKRTRWCKVCSILTPPGERTKETTNYCVECSASSLSDGEFFYISTLNT